MILDAEAQRFRQRLALWKQRCEELAPPVLSRETGRRGVRPILSSAN